MLLYANTSSEKTQLTTEAYSGGTDSEPLGLQFHHIINFYPLHSGLFSFMKTIYETSNQLKFGSLGNLKQPMRSKQKEIWNLRFKIDWFNSFIKKMKIYWGLARNTI